MRFKKVIPFIIFFVISGCNNENKIPNVFHADSDELTIITEKTKGLGALPVSFTRVTDFNRTPGSPWKNVAPTYMGIPDTLQNITVSTNPVNWQQFVFQSFKKGRIDSSFFNMLLNSWEMDGQSRFKAR